MRTANNNHQRQTISHALNHETSLGNLFRAPGRILTTTLESTPDTGGEPNNPAGGLNKVWWLTGFASHFPREKLI